MSSEGQPNTATIAELAESSRRFANWIDHVRQLIARDLGLHVTDYRCLVMVHDAHGPVSPKQVAEEFGLSTGSTTALIDRLERAGLIRRIPNPEDRRGVLLELDLHQARRTVQSYSLLPRFYDTVLTGFTDAELKTITRFFDRVTGADAAIAKAVKAVEDHPEASERQSGAFAE